MSVVDTEMHTWEPLGKYLSSPVGGEISGWSSAISSISLLLPQSATFSGIDFSRDGPCQVTEWGEDRKARLFQPDTGQHEGGIILELRYVVWGFTWSGS
jgi:hypothetical protein